MVPSRAASTFFLQASGTGTTKSLLAHQVERFLLQRVYEKSFVAQQYLRCQIQVRTIVIHTIHSDETVNIAGQVTAGTGHWFGSRIDKHRTSKHHAYGIGFIDPVDHHESQ